MFIDRNLADALKVEDPGKLDPHGLYKLITDAIEPKLPYLARGGEQPKVIMENIDYGMATPVSRWEKLSDIKGLDTAEVITIPRLGGNEGVYTDVYFLIREYGKEDRQIPIFTYKTLGEGFDDCCMMGALAGALSYAVELFLWQNVW